VQVAIDGEAAAVIASADAPARRPPRDCARRCGLTGRRLVRAREQAVAWDAFALQQTSVASGEAVTIGCCQQPMGTAANFPVRRTSRPRSLAALTIA
jgi:hypothetical protein